MDPRECFRLYLDAVRRVDVKDRLFHASNLRRWLKSGGFPPRISVNGGYLPLLGITYGDVVAIQGLTVTLNTPESPRATGKRFSIHVIEVGEIL